MINAWKGLGGFDPSASYLADSWLRQFRPLGYECSQTHDYRAPHEVREVGLGRPGKLLTAIAWLDLLTVGGIAHVRY